MSNLRDGAMSELGEVMFNDALQDETKFRALKATTRVFMDSEPEQNVIMQLRMILLYLVPTEATGEDFKFIFDSLMKLVGRGSEENVQSH